MKAKHSLSLAGALLAFLAVATSLAPQTGTSVYIERILSSDPAGTASRTIQELADPWGLAQAPTGEWWIANHRDGVLLAVSRKGSLVSGSVITIPSFTPTPGLPPRPTGLVYNRSQDFILGTGTPARLIAATQAGTIAAWSPEAGNGQTALVVVDNSDFAVYTGITMGEKNGKHYLYAANFRTGSVDVFDGLFVQQEQGEEQFFDPTIPEDYAPFNVLFSGERLYVLYALQNADRTQPAPGVGDRFVSVFDAEGALLKQLAPRQGYESAWGLALAPEGFGRYEGMLLLANAENGTVAAIDPEDGAFRGLLVKPDNWLVTIPGVRGMAFDSGAPQGGVQKLFFCAGVDGGEHGLFGYVMPQQ